MRLIWLILPTYEPRVRAVYEAHFAHLREPLRLSRLFSVPPRLLLWLPPFLLAFVPIVYATWNAAQPSFLVCWFCLLLILRNRSINLRQFELQVDMAYSRLMIAGHRRRAKCRSESPWPLTVPHLTVYLLSFILA